MQSSFMSPSVNPSHARALRELRAELEDRGLMAPSTFWRGKLLFWIPTFFISFLALVLLPIGPTWFLLVPVSSVAFLTMGFVGHDAGHYALSRKPWVNDLWGQVAMTWLCGMSFGYWRKRHNQHHFHCQEIGTDPDMHFGVLFSVYPDSDNWHTSLGRFFLKIQTWAFWPLASLYWVSLRYDGIRDCVRQPRETRVDRFLIAAHWIVLVIVPGLIWGWAPTLLAYLAVSCLSSLMTASVFIPNHIGLRHLRPGEKLSYLEQQVSTSRNIANPPILDFFYGGLNSQIEHHLFPRVGHVRYRAMRPVVRAFCEARGLPYQETSLLCALASVGRHLRAMTAAFRRRPLVASSIQRPDSGPA